MYSIYILTNTHKTVTYVGVTNNLVQRIVEHYLNRLEDESFAGRYNCYWLIYYEHFEYVNAAIEREKEIKRWNRKKKRALIEKFNPEWKFLNCELFDVWPPLPRDLYHRKTG